MTQQNTSNSALARLSAVLALLLWSQVANASDLTGRVVGVHDGDTITILTGAHTQLKVRLHGIDAPELKQAFGRVSKEALSRLVFGRNVTVKETDTDRYGRTVADVFFAGQWINLTLVERGMAWVYVKYSNDSRLVIAEQKARETKSGLWKDKAPVPPWDWRKVQSRR